MGLVFRDILRNSNHREIKTKTFDTQRILKTNTLLTRSTIRRMKSYILLCVVLFLVSEASCAHKGCLMYDTVIMGNHLMTLHGLGMWMECGELCYYTPDCGAWVWTPMWAPSKCILMEADENTPTDHDIDTLSGYHGCK